MREKRASQKEDSENTGGWLTTYGDMMTLLMTFFILITSYSTIELVKFKQALGSLQGALGILENDSAMPGQKGELIQRRDVLSHSLEEIKVYISENNLEGLVEITPTEEGVYFRLSNPLLFDLGKANLKPVVYGILSQIANMLRKAPCEVIVEGHTDNLPIHTPQFLSNWELSAARALSVVKYFAYQEKIPPARLTAVGYGEYRPIAPNISDEGRSKNRRVEIFVRWESIDPETQSEAENHEQMGMEIKG